MGFETLCITPVLNLTRHLRGFTTEDTAMPLRATGFVRIHVKLFVVKNRIMRITDLTGWEI
jgi:hypothetical protein